MSLQHIKGQKKTGAVGVKLWWYNNGLKWQRDYWTLGQGYFHKKRTEGSKKKGAKCVQKEVKIVEIGAIDLLIPVFQGIKNSF